MEPNSSKINNFRDLIAWKKSHELVLLIYKITESFPKTEMFGLVSQLRRASVSITSNIAEGFGRRTTADKNHFYTMSIGSGFEVLNQLIVSRDLKYLSVENFAILEGLLTESRKLTYGLIHR